MRTAAFAWVAILLGAGSASAQVTTVCSLSGNTAYCTSNDQGARIAEQQREQYETGAAIGSSIGSAIFRAHFPGWRRKYCSTHPGQPFVYSNAAGDSISGTCPSAEGLANEVASEWLAKHPDYKPAPENGQTMVAYIAEHHLSFFEKKSYDEAFRDLKANGPRKFDRPAPSAPSNSTPQDVFVWFDETAPASGAPLFELLSRPALTIALSTCCGRLARETLRSRPERARSTRTIILQP